MITQTRNYDWRNGILTYKPQVRQLICILFIHFFFHTNPHQYNFTTMATNIAANMAQAHFGEVPVAVSNEDKERHSESDMLACCWMGKNKLEMKRVPKPDITDDEDVLLRITASTGEYCYLLI